MSTASIRFLGVSVAVFALVYGLKMGFGVLFGGNDALVRAIDAGNSSSISSMLDRGADPSRAGHTESGSKYTPLGIAAWKGDIKTVQLLLDHGANPHYTGRSGYTPLHETRENAEIIKLLVSKGADVNAKNIVGDTPLHEQDRDGTPAIVKALLESGAKIDALNDNGETPLVKLLKMKYGTYRQLPVIAAMLTGKPNLSIADRDGNTALGLMKKRAEEHPGPERIELLEMIEEAGRKSTSRGLK